MEDNKHYPDDRLFCATVKGSSDGTSDELIRVCADGRVFAFDRNGEPWAIDAAALLTALLKTRSVGETPVA